MSDAHPTDSVVTSWQGDYDSLRFVSPETPCPYLPGLSSRSEAYYVEQLDGAHYQRLLARGFRRSGRVVYRPRCRSCQACRSIRVPVHQFVESRSMRRIRRKNADVRVRAGRPVATREKFEIFHRYLDRQHDDTMARNYESFESFLYDSPIESLEFCYRLGDRLIGVGLADCVPNGLSSVYMYFDPDFADRSPGTLSVLREVDYCKQAGIAYYYLGYYVAGSKTMAYKARFRPNEILVGDDRWLVFSA